MDSRIVILNLTFSRRRSRRLGRRLKHSECEIKRRAFFGFRLRPDAPAVTVDDALDGCQPDAGAGKFTRRVQALERAEEFVCVRHIEASAVIFYEVYRFSLTSSPLSHRERGEEVRATCQTEFEPVRAWM